MFFERRESHPVVLVVAGCVSQETDVIGRSAAAFAPGFEKSIQTLPHQGAGAVTGLLRNQERRRQPTGLQEIRLAHGWEPFLLKLCANAQRGFQLPAIRRARRWNWDG